MRGEQRIGWCGERSEKNERRGEERSGEERIDEKSRGED
jgi:hypothetical protein